MSNRVRAVRYRNLDEARRVLAEYAPSDLIGGLFDDAGNEPQGLLAAIPEDLVPEEVFYRLFGGKQGVLVELERIPYSGYGPPAEEPHYMGYVSIETAYVLAGCRLSVEIESCPLGARDIHHLEAMVLDRQHPIDREHLAGHLRLQVNWDFDDVFDLILTRAVTAEEVDRLIHRGIQ